MKRFYCNGCKKSVRVRRLPAGVTMEQGAKGPVYVGSPPCQHYSLRPRPAAPQRPERTSFSSPAIPLAPDAGRSQRPRKRA